MSIDSHRLATTTCDRDNGSFMFVLHFIICSLVPLYIVDVESMNFFLTFEMARMQLKFRLSGGKIESNDKSSRPISTNWPRTFITWSDDRMLRNWNQEKIKCRLATIYLYKNDVQWSKSLVWPVPRAIGLNHIMQGETYELICQCSTLTMDIISFLCYNKIPKHIRQQHTGNMDQCWAESKMTK